MQPHTVTHATDHRGTRRGTGPLTLGILLASVLALGACESMSERQQGTAAGAGVGAVAGAAIGAATGGKAGPGALIGGAVGAIAGNLWSKHMEDKREAMTKATAGTGIDVVRTSDNQIMVNVPGDFSFDVGQSDIKPAMRPVLDQFVHNLDSTMRVSIVGHTDSTGSDAINRPLSMDRAQSVRDYLSYRGLAPARVDVSGRGATEPVADNGSELGRAQNRRVQIFLREPAA